MYAEYRSENRYHPQLIKLQGCKSKLKLLLELKMRLKGQPMPSIQLQALEAGRVPILTQPLTSVQMSFESPICYDHFESGCRHTCGNTFCEDCLNLWTEVAQTCPLCRSALE